MHRRAFRFRPLLRAAFRIPLHALAAALVVLAATPPLHAAPRHGKVIAVADGDTLVLVDGRRQRHRIRLDGIDAPERNQPYGRRARASLAALTQGRHAAVDCPRTDRYGRAVCRVMVDGVDVGLEQVRRGLAWHRAGHAGAQAATLRANYAHAEQHARRARAGLWAARDPTPPWDYRRAARGT